MLTRPLPVEGSELAALFVLAEVDGAIIADVARHAGMTFEAARQANRRLQARGLTRPTGTRPTRARGQDPTTWGPTEKGARFLDAALSLL